MAWRGPYRFCKVLTNSVYLLKAAHDWSTCTEVLLDAHMYIMAILGWRPSLSVPHTHFLGAGDAPRLCGGLPDLFMLSRGNQPELVSAAETSPATSPRLEAPMICTPPPPRRNGCRKRPRAIQLSSKPGTSGRKKHTHTHFYLLEVRNTGVA